VEALTRLSRLVVATLALTGLLGLVSGCTRSDGGDDIHDIRCERRSVRPAKDDGSLASALAQQAADNRAYRECVERHGFRWSG
jgi:hypothetical protein